MRLKDIANIVKGQLYGGDQSVSGFSIDSRTISDKQCFVAIKGERFDGHGFIENAVSAGASACIVSEDGHFPEPFIRVSDTLQALSRLAAFHRKQVNIPIAAVTGSCGKTTVKEMIALMLPKPSFATKGNFNNHIGVPLSLLSLNASFRYAVFELGANHIGEIAQTVALVKPTVALITNVASAHLEGFGSLDGVARAKAEIFEGLDAEGVMVVNMDDKRIVEKANTFSKQTVTFSYDNDDADVYAKHVRLSSTGSHFSAVVSGHCYDIELNVPGKHNVVNALAALSVIKGLACPLEDAAKQLAYFRPVAGRMTTVKGYQDACIIDDTYNANLNSVKAAIDVLSAHSGPKVFVLGELAEVGASLEEHYRLIGEHASRKKIDLFLSCGKLASIASKAFSGESIHFEHTSDLVQRLRQRLTIDTTVLVKGSRSAKMERVVHGLLA